MDLTKRIQNLKPGNALKSNRWIIARKRDGKLICGRDGPDEPSLRGFVNTNAAVTTLDQWLHIPGMRVEPKEVMIPQDMEESDWIYRTLEQMPL